MSQNWNLGFLPASSAAGAVHVESNDPGFSEDFWERILLLLSTFHSGFIPGAHRKGIPAAPARALHRLGRLLTTVRAPGNESEPPCVQPLHVRNVILGFFLKCLGKYFSFFCFCLLRNEEGPRKACWFLAGGCKQRAK